MAKDGTPPRLPARHSDHNRPRRPTGDAEDRLAASRPGTCRTVARDPQAVKLQRRITVGRAHVGVDFVVSITTASNEEVEEISDEELKRRLLFCDEIRAWEKTFPDELWRQFARLEGIRDAPGRRPWRWGKYVMEMVYDALDPEVGAWLRQHAPAPDWGCHYHQWLTEQLGLPLLMRHIGEVIGMARMCRSMRELRRQVQHHYRGQPLQLELPLRAA